MKILAFKFALEANENVPTMCDIEHVAFHFGEQALVAMQLEQAKLDEGVQLIPVFSANPGSSGVMKYNCFQYIVNRLLDSVKEHLNDLDGIYLHLHGASFIEKIGSGDFYILKEVRKLVGPYIPIVVACDPHGNLCQEYVENTQLIRSYRHSPHIDVRETNEFVLYQLIDLIRSRQNIHSIYRKLPLILGGEQSVSQDEPVKTINVYLDELEKDPRVRSASWHVGYIRHDCPEAGCGIVVVPATQSDQLYCEEVADRLAEYVFGKRHEFHYTGVTASIDEALKMAFESENRPNFVTDSGDNVTAGAGGYNTELLREILSMKKLDKRILFASIHDEDCFQYLASKKPGSITEIDLGADYDRLSAPVHLRVEVGQRSFMQGTSLFGEKGNQFGECIFVHVCDTPIDILVADSNHPFVERHQVLAAGVDWFDYDVTFVKCGYAFPELVKDGHVAVMALTDGATLQDTARLPFKRIMRPMYPIDKI